MRILYLYHSTPCHRYTLTPGERNRTLPHCTQTKQPFNQIVTVVGWGDSGIPSRLRPVRPSTPVKNPYVATLTGQLPKLVVPPAAESIGITRQEAHIGPPRNLNVIRRDFRYKPIPPHLRHRPPPGGDTLHLFQQTRLGASTRARGRLPTPLRRRNKRHQTTPRSLPRRDRRIHRHTHLRSHRRTLIR